MYLRSRTSMFSAALLAAVAWTVSVPAQQQTAAASATDSGALEEVVVTARKETERLVDVPLAITAFTVTDIENYDIRNLNDVAHLTPGLTFSSVEGEFLPTPVIRGFAPIEVRRSDNNTAIFVDGVYVSGREGLNFNQLDLERIEVIKGPQAALYGRDSFSGAINYVTARPTDEFHAKAEVQAGDAGKALASVSLAGPIVDTLKGRIAFQTDQYDGTYQNQYYKNPYAGLGPDVNINGHDFRTLQGSLYWTPTDKLDGWLTGYLSHDQIGTSATSAVPANCEDLNANIPGSFQPNYGNYCGTFQAVGKDGLAAIPQATGEDRHLARVNLHLSWDTGVGTLISTTGYSHLSHSYYVDGSRDSLNGVDFAYLQNPLTSVEPFGPGFSAPEGTLGFFQAGLLQIGPPQTTDEWSEELRFSTPKDQPLRGSLGVYYYNTKDQDGLEGVIGTTPLPANNGTLCLACADANTFGQPTAGNATIDLGGGDPGIWTPWFTNPGAQSSAADYTMQKTTAPSVFGSLEYDFASQWHSSLEARYTQEKRSFVDNTLALTCFAPGVCEGPVSSASATFNLVSWRGTLDFKPTDGWTIYGSVASAQKPGGFGDVTASFTTNSIILPGEYGSEKNIGGELGTKAELVDRRLYVDVDVYYYKWKNIAVPQIYPEYANPAAGGAVQPLTQPIEIDTNVGDAKLYGLEFQVEDRVTDHFKAMVSGSFLEAKFTNAVVSSFDQFPTYYPTGDISGNTLQRTSKLQGALTLDYSDQIVSTVGWYARGDLSYRGKQYADNTDEAILPALTFLNAHLGLKGEHWSAEVWGKNLTNEDKPTDAFRDVYFSNALPGNITYAGPPGVDATGNAGTGTIFPWRYSVSYPELRTFGVTVWLRF